LENAILTLTVGGRDKDSKTEISSFAAAMILAIATKNSFIKKRYALAEAKTAYTQMLNEPKDNIVSIAKDFNWNLNSGKPYHDFSLDFTFYLMNASHLRGYDWKLVNQILTNGLIYLNKDKAVRLLQEEVRNRIEKRLDVSEIKNLPEAITIIANKLTELAQEKLGQMESEELPKVVVKTAFPPCLTALIEGASSTHHLSHVERFTLVSFLVNIGMSSEAVTELFKTFSDYNERLTRYQVEHIAGERGSGTRYTPPQCSVLQTHGVCKNRDDLCRRIYHPLVYYKRKQKLALIKSS
jgi:DNA primase large subunit